MATDNYWTRRVRFGRRTALKGGAVGALGVAGLALVGCGGDDSGTTGEPTTTTFSQNTPQAGASPSPAGEQPIPGGTVVMPGSDGGIFDPAIAIHGGTASSTFGVYDFLNMRDSELKMVAGMAELPEQPDPLTVIYKIKPDVFWQDKAPLNGRQFTAEDAAFGLKRFGQDNKQFVFRDRFSAVSKYEVVDKLTLKITLSQPFAPFTSNVAEESTLMVSRDVVDAVGDQAVSSDFSKAIGTGPWLATSRKEGVELVFDRNPKYYRKGQPYFDQWRILIFADAAARLAAFVAGQTDMANAHWTGAPAELKQLQDQLGKDAVQAIPNPVTYGFATHFNTKVKPYNDPRVRTALHLATDRNQIVAVALGGLVLGGPVAGVIAPYGITAAELIKRPGYRKDAERAQDLKDAKALLDASGVDLKSIPKMQVWTGSSNYGQVLQANWKEIGFNVEIEELATADALAARAGRTTFSIMNLGQQGAGDPDLLYNDLHTKGAQNYGDFSNSEIDALLEKGRTTIGLNDRKAVYDQLQDKLLKELNPRVWHTWSTTVIMLRPDLRGFRAHPSISAGNVILAGTWRAKKK